MIKITGLSKTFAGSEKGTVVEAVRDLTLEVAEGEVFGFLGPNGAGKTTTVRMLCALIAPTTGSASINGHSLGRNDQAIRRTVGILTETPGLYDRLSAEANLKVFAELYDVPDPDAAVKRYLGLLGLWDRRKDAAGSFSKGMRQKLAIARALLHEPRVLFLDEPTSGLDPEAARLVREFIGELRGEGRTIFLTTHNLDEADRLCDRIGIFKTRLMAVDTPAALRQTLYGRQVVFHLARLDPAWVSAVAEVPGVQDARAAEGRLVVRLDDPEANNPAILRRLIGLGADVQFVGELRHSLEDIYLRFVNHGAEAGS